MLEDIVIPDGNEAEFAEIARRLGCKKMIFLYNFEGYTEKRAKKIESIRESHNMPIEEGLIVNPKNMDRASKLSKTLVAKSSENDRLIIESGKIKIIYGFEDLQRKDHLHQRASGLNHVLCDLARKNNVSIGFSYSSLLSKNKILAAISMGRMLQNIRLCQKFKTKTNIGSFSSHPYSMRAFHDVQALFKMLGKSILQNQG